MLTTSDLTPGERFLILRRRNGLSQPVAAKSYGLSAWDYRMVEADRVRSDLPRPALGKIAAHERCVILRRRAGMKRTQLAALVGCSNWWLTQMERGVQPPDRIVEYWANA